MRIAPWIALALALAVMVWWFWYLGPVDFAGIEKL